MKETSVASVADKQGQPTLFRDQSVFIEQLLPAARARLVTIADDAPLHDAAKLLRAGTDLVVVCEANGIMVGVITKSDVVARIGECQGAACMTAAARVMSTEILQCVSSDLVHEVWKKMRTLDLKNIPIADAEGRPVGILNARDALGVLLQEVTSEESLLRDYVMGVGYH
jgi:CBS domain-containing protein